MGNYFAVGVLAVSAGLFWRICVHYLGMTEPRRSMNAVFVGIAALIVGVAAIRFALGDAPSIFQPDRQARAAIFGAIVVGGVALLTAMASSRILLVAKPRGWILGTLLLVAFVAAGYGVVLPIPKDNEFGLFEATAAKGGRATATAGLPSYGPDNAFSDAQKPWEMPGPRGWIAYEVPEALKCKGYRVTAARGWIDRAPQDWIFEASEDGKAWVPISVQKDQTWQPDNPTDLFVARCPKAFRHFRWNILRNEGGPTLLINKIELY